MPDIVVLILIVCMAGSIAMLSLLPSDARTMTLVPPKLHRIGHLICYAVFAFLCILALELTLINLISRSLIGFLIASGFGVTIEFLQKFRPGRAPNLGDALVDIAGAALGGLAAFGWILGNS